MSLEKIGKILISEAVEAIFFLLIIYVVASFPEFSGKSDLITGLYSFWILSGLATPLIIWVEAEDAILHALGGLKIK